MQALVHSPSAEEARSACHVCASFLVLQKRLKARNMFLSEDARYMTCLVLKTMISTPHGWRSADAFPTIDYYGFFCISARKFGLQGSHINLLDPALSLSLSLYYILTKGLVSRKILDDFYEIRCPALLKARMLNSMSSFKSLPGYSMAYREITNRKRATKCGHERQEMGCGGSYVFAALPKCL